MNECIVYTRYVNGLENSAVRPDPARIRNAHKGNIRPLLAVVLIALSFFCGFLMQASAAGQNNSSVSAYSDSSVAAYPSSSVNGEGTIVLEAEQLPLADSAAPAPLAERPLMIDVAPGDTLWGIANEYAGKQSNRSFINEIVKLNKLESKLLQVGQVLLLPPGK